MNYALVGRGRMGRAVERLAAGRGHRPALVVDPVPSEDRPWAAAVNGAGFDGVDVAFEFTRPDQAEANVRGLLEAGVSVVCGTTGWAPPGDLNALARERQVAAVIAPNFSVGMNLFFRVVQDAAARFGSAGGYHDWILESHHRGKVDAPSGTAAALARIVAAADPRKPAVVEGNPGGALAENAVHVASLRAGHEPGMHQAGFDSVYDEIVLSHRLRDRDGLALGAVLAAEWLPGRTGLFDFQPVLDDLIEKGT